jgi:hypothetical protein
MVLSNHFSRLVRARSISSPAVSSARLNARRSPGSLIRDSPASNPLRMAAIVSGVSGVPSAAGSRPAMSSSAVAKLRAGI